MNKSSQGLQYIYIYIYFFFFWGGGSGDPYKPLLPTFNDAVGASKDVG